MQLTGGAARFSLATFVVVFVAVVVTAFVSRDARAQPRDGDVDAGSAASSEDGDAGGAGEDAAPPPREEKDRVIVEDNSSSDTVAHASLEIGGYRDSVAVGVLTPSLAGRVESPTHGWNVNGRYLVDVVTAASPDIVASASPRWTEVRHAGNLGGRYKPGNTGVGLSAATSYTPDYLSLSANGQFLQDFDEKNLTLSLGYGFGHDVIGRTTTPFSIFSRTLDYHSFQLGASRVVNRSLVIAVATDVIVERGDQSKPYRYIPIFSPADAPTIERGASVDTIASKRLQARPLEQLPLERERAAITARLAWRLTSSTIRLDQRFYGDTWGLRATTTDARWLVDAGSRVTIWPHLRLNVQNSVDFWQRAYVATSVHDIPAIRTGDRELSALLTTGVGGGLRLALGKQDKVDTWVLTTTVDGAWTSFKDTVYLKERFSLLATTALEVEF